MWIRSQDKGLLIDTKEFYINKGNNQNVLIKCTSYDIGSDILGEYSTYEKALKVLDMIQDFIDNEDNYVMDAKGKIGPQPKVFQMPEDNEVE